MKCNHIVIIKFCLYFCHVCEMHSLTVAYRSSLKDMRYEFIASSVSVFALCRLWWATFLQVDNIYAVVASAVTTGDEYI